MVMIFTRPPAASSDDLIHQTTSGRCRNLMEDTLEPSCRAGFNLL